MCLEQFSNQLRRKSKTATQVALGRVPDRGGLHWNETPGAAARTTGRRWSSGAQTADDHWPLDSGEGLFSFSPWRTGHTSSTSQRGRSLLQCLGTVWHGLSRTSPPQHQTLPSGREGVLVPTSCKPGWLDPTKQNPFSRTRSNAKPAEGPCWACASPPGGTDKKH